MAQKGKPTGPALDLAKVRNIGIIAHIDAGKTTTTERVLYYTGLVHRMGEVHDGAATTDYMEQERERGITITAAAVTAFWRDHQINIIDTPGHADFGGEVERVLNMVDGALLLVDAVEGPMPQTRFVLKKALEMGHQAVVVINKVDRPAARPHEARAVASLPSEPSLPAGGVAGRAAKGPRRVRRTPDPPGGREPPLGRARGRRRDPCRRRPGRPDKPRR